MASSPQPQAPVGGEREFQKEDDFPEIMMEISEDIDELLLYEEEEEEEENVPPVEDHDGPLQKKMRNSDEDVVVVQSMANGGKTEDVFQVLSAEQVVAHMKDLIQKVSGMLNLPPSTSHQLLSHFRWDEGKLLDIYFGGDEQAVAKMFKDAHAPVPDAASTPPPVSLKDGQQLCDVCCDEKSAQDMFGLSCGHLYCTRCWDSHLSLQILEEGTPLISCLAPSCFQLVPEESLLQLVTDPKTRSRYQALLPEHFVATHPLFKWCPGPDCPNAVKILSSEYRHSNVTCTCGHTFCFQCALLSHEPVDCQMMTNWIKSDSGTCSWMVVNSKNCPKCSAPIEKNGGCNYIQCQKCKYAFCWICMGKWENHDWWNCNRFNPNDPQQLAYNTQVAQGKRHLFYYNRYASHRDSLQLEEKLGELVEVKMQEFQRNQGMSWVDVQFMKRAVDALHRCRQTLMHTYVFAFYGENNAGNNQLEIFEGNQQDLQQSVEKLSGYLEREVEVQEDARALKQEVVNMTNYCEGRRKVLLDHVNEGNEKEWWKFRSFS